MEEVTRLRGLTFSVPILFGRNNESLSSKTRSLSHVPGVLAPNKTRFGISIYPSVFG